MRSTISAILSLTYLCPWWLVLTFWRGFIHRDKSPLSWNPSFDSLLPLCLMVSTKTILAWCVDNILTWFYFPSPADGGTEVSHSTVLFWICSENRQATQNTCFIVWRSRITDSYLPHRPFKQVSSLKKFFFESLYVAYTEFYFGLLQPQPSDKPGSSMCSYHSSSKYSPLLWSRTAGSPSGQNWSH